MGVVGPARFSAEDVTADVALLPDLNIGAWVPLLDPMARAEATRSARADGPSVRRDVDASAPATHLSAGTLNAARAAVVDVIARDPGLPEPHSHRVALSDGRVRAVRVAKHPEARVVARTERSSFCFPSLLVIKCFETLSL